MGDGSFTMCDEGHFLLIESYIFRENFLGILGTWETSFLGDRWNISFSSTKCEKKKKKKSKNYYFSD